MKTINNFKFCKLKTVFVFFILLANISVYAQKNVYDISRTGTVEELKKIYSENPNIINTKNEMGYTPLVLACYSGNEAVVSFLVDKVESINGEYAYGSPLMAATVKGYSKIVNILLQHKANPNLTDAKGTTAGHYAVMYRNYDIVEQLINANTDFYLKNNVGKSAMDFVLEYKDEQLFTLFKI